MKTIIIIWIILGLIYVVIEFIKDHIEAIIGIVVIILAIAVIRVFLPIIAPLIPYAIPIFAIYIIVRAINNCAMKERASSYLKWLEGIGIDQPEVTPEYEKVFQWIKKQGYVETFLSDHIISVSFYEKIRYYFDQKQEMSDAEFQKCCFDAAPQFRSEYIKPLLEFLQGKKIIFQFSTLGEGKYHYVSTKLLRECKCLFEDEGAATEDEFSEICGKILLTPFLKKERSRLARIILEDMHSGGLARRVNLRSEEFKNVNLYIAKNQKSTSKMKKVIINMDN